MGNSQSDETKESLIIKSIGTAEVLIANVESDDNLSKNQKNTKAYDIVDAVFLATERGEALSGSADDFHNFAVTLVRLSEDYETALEIIELGLQLHPSNTDLLSDAIRYGLNCGKQSVCEKRVVELNRLPKTLWTWRAFSFYIDYILAMLGNIVDATEYEVNKKADEAISLSKEYQQYFPQDEDSWYSEYLVYKAINDREKSMKLLKDIVEHNIEQAPVLCPKSWLRYADENIEMGNAAEAEKYIEKLRKHPEASDTVNFSYVYYLDGLCQLKEIINDDDFSQERVLKAYRSFRLGLKHKSLYSNNKIKIMDKIQMLEDLSDIVYPWKNEIV